MSASDAARRHPTRHGWVIGGILLLMVAAASYLTRGDSATEPDYLRATYSPLHFQPAIATATDAQCLACHREVLENGVRKAPPAGIAAATGAPYRKVSTYEGEQDTFHRRHLVMPLARQLMDLRCNTCHQGHDPREEAPGSSATAQRDAAFALRKQVDPDTCLMCHGRMPWEHMGLPGPWADVKASFGNNCLTACHESIRTVRHQVGYLKPEAIEAAGRQDGEACHGCHGGRAWYRIAYPYPRHAWPGMAAAVPDWARERPTASAARFSTRPAVRQFKP